MQLKIHVWEFVLIDAFTQQKDAKWRGNLKFGNGNKL
jgi:hypothetical protein